MTKRAATRIAVAWLLEEDWPRWRAIDPELPGYDRWLEKIDQAIGEAESRGMVAERITVDPDAFAKWCRDIGEPLNRNTRSRYAAEQLRRRAGMH